jgi:hypothetical protein
MQRLYIQAFNLWGWPPTLLLIVAACAISRPAVAQSTPPDAVAERPATQRSGHVMSAGYFGHNFTHPGFVVGYRYRALSTQDDLHALTVGVDVGSYFWARHDDGLFVLPKVGWRGRAAFGLQGELDAYLGYLQGFLPGDVYEVVDGQARKTTASFPFMLFGLTTGAGWCFDGVADAVDLIPFARVGALWQYPMFDQVLVRFVLTVGVEVRL